MIFPAKFVRAQTCNITSTTFTEETEYGMNSEVAKRGNPHKWLIDFQTPPMQQELIRELGAFIDSLDGRYESFTFESPLRFMGATSTFRTNESVAAGNNVISVRDLPINATGVLRAGDFIMFSNHPKVYKIVKTVDSNTSGLASMTIVPRLFSNVTDGAYVSEAVFTCRMTKDKSSLPLDGRKALTALKISMKEDNY